MKAVDERLNARNLGYLMKEIKVEKVNKKINHKQFFK